MEKKYRIKELNEYLYTIEVWIESSPIFFWKKSKWVKCDYLGNPIPRGNEAKFNSLEDAKIIAKSWKREAEERQKEPVYHYID